MGILNSIRQKSDNQKKVFSLVTAIILTLVIVIVWFSLTSDSPAKIAEEGNKLSSISPMQVIKEEFSKAFSGFKESTGNIKKIISTTSEEIIIATTTISSSGEISTTSEKIN